MRTVYTLEVRSCDNVNKIQSQYNITTVRFISSQQTLKDKSVNTQISTPSVNISYDRRLDRSVR